MTVSVIIPVHNGEATLAECLRAIESSTYRPIEVVVVDDGSTDGTASLAQGFGAKVVRVQGSPLGPGAARNLGAKTARGDLLVFVDADVVVHRGALRRIVEHLESFPDVAALFGSYDANPPARNWVSRYKNLLHHHTHQVSRREASTFWAGCGAVRREAFRAVGGFDKAYGRPSIEDIELGVRLRRAGYRVWSCPDVQSTHLKRWSLVNLIRTDIFQRAVPWTQLILSQGQMPTDLNLSMASRISALASWLFVAFLPAGFFAPWAWMGAVAAAAVVAICNRSLFALFRRTDGVAFVGGAFFLHVLYFLYSSATFATLTVFHAISPRPSAASSPMLSGTVSVP